jgi:hypothetical protein
VKLFFSVHDLTDPVMVSVYKDKKIVDLFEDPTQISQLENLVEFLSKIGVESEVEFDSDIV